MKGINLFYSYLDMKKIMTFCPNNCTRHYNERNELILLFPLDSFPHKLLSLILSPTHFASLTISLSHALTTSFYLPFSLSQLSVWTHLSISISLRSSFSIQFHHSLTRRAAKFSVRELSTLPCAHRWTRLWK